VLNECKGSGRGCRDLLILPLWWVVPYYWARPGSCQGLGEGLVASAGGGAPALWAGLGGAGIIVVVLGVVSLPRKPTGVNEWVKGAATGYHHGWPCRSHGKRGADVSSLGDGWNA